MKPRPDRRSLSPAQLRTLMAPLRRAGAAFARVHPGDSERRQPIHTVYGGAHLFKADAAPKLGALALRSLQEYAPDPMTFGAAIGLEPPAGAAAAPFAARVYERVVEKLKREPVEDFRIDFEDGFGHRPDPEEDQHAERAARELARGLAQGTLPPFVGIRIKPFSPELAARGLRTLDGFLSTLLAETRHRVPEGFVVTLPKVTLPEQVAALAKALGLVERRHRLPAGSLKLEIMVETPQAILDPRGASALRALVAAGQGRCLAAHFGTYDYTALCNVTAAHQAMTHPACDFAKHVMQVALAGTGVTLSDGASNIMPVPPHRAAPGAALSSRQLEENRATVHRAWRRHYEDVRHSLRHAYYQGWDLHPAQLPTRYAAVYAFFLEGLEAACARLANFMHKAAQATLVGEVFDDAATGQGLLNFFLRGLSCGAITPQEAAATGLTIEELKTRSFLKILEGRRRRQG